MRSVQAPSYYGSTQWHTEHLHCPSVDLPTRTQEGRAWYMAIKSAAKAHIPATAFEAGPSNRTAILRCYGCLHASPLSHTAALLVTACAPDYA